MNEKVTDISEALLTMTEEMRLMRETINSQHAEICNLNRNTEALHKEIRNLKKENESLLADCPQFSSKCLYLWGEPR